MGFFARNAADSGVGAIAKARLVLAEAVNVTVEKEMGMAIGGFCLNAVN